MDSPFEPAAAKNASLASTAERLALLDTVLANVDAHIYLKNGKGCYLYANDKVLKLYGRSAAEVMGRTDLDLLDRTVAERLMAVDRMVLDTMSRHACEEQVVDPAGGTHHYWSVKLPLVREDGSVCLVGFSTEITELLVLRQTLERQRVTDPLTGLPNRVQFEEELSMAMRMAARAGEPLSVALLDLDQFKYINTHLSQDVGDQLLREAAQRLRSCLPTDSGLARVGGDEFAVLLASIGDGRSADAQIDGLRACLAEPFLLLGKPLHVTASAGLAQFPQDAVDAAALMRCAEAAMYLAKDRGRDQARRYTAELSAAASQRVELEHALRGALAAGQFELHYQPKVRAADGTVAGLEALLRWRRPGHGLVSPAHFIPLAEQLGLLVQIGPWVVEEACRQMAAWRELGLGEVSVAVNLSPSQLRSTGLLDSVCASVERHAVAHGQLELEVTESMMMDEPEAAIAILRELSSEGVHISIDDFGTGYSSMAYLKRLPVDTLKLDRHFVSEIASDTRDADLCAGVIALAHKLGLQVVAEGVETEDQAEALRSRECDMFQGYLFGRPAAAEEMTSYLRASAPPREADDKL